MRWLAWLFIGLLLLVDQGCSGNSTTIHITHPAIWSDGTWIRDQQGRVVILHGINVSEAAKHPPYLPFTSTAISGNTLQQNLTQNLERLKNLGLDAVRLVIIWAAIEPIQGTINTNYIDQLQEEVQICKDNGLLVLLDMHQDLYSESFCYGDGAPAWASNLTGYDVSRCYINNSSQNIALWGLNYTLPQIRQSFQNLWDDKPGPDGIGLQEHYLAAFQALAQRFSKTTNILGYDIMNEPYPGEYPLFTTEFDQKALVPFYEKIASSIRSIDPDHIIVFEPSLTIGNVLNGFKTGISETTFTQEFKNLLFSPHFYPVNPVDISTIVPGFNAIKALSFAMKVPWFIGEFGMNYNTPGSANYMITLLNAFDTYMAGWFNWSYDGAYEPGQYDTTRPDMSPYYPDGTPRSLVDQNGRPVFYGIDVLSRPYPMFTAGTPVRISYPITSDPSSFTTTAFTYTYKEDGIGRGTTEIFISQIHFPDGFTVTTSDGIISFDPLTSVLSYIKGSLTTHTITVSPCNPGNSTCIIP